MKTNFIKKIFYFGTFLFLPLCMSHASVNEKNEMESARQHETDTEKTQFADPQNAQNPSDTAQAQDSQQFQDTNPIGTQFSPNDSNTLNQVGVNTPSNSTSGQNSQPTPQAVASNSTPSRPWESIGTYGSTHPKGPGASKAF